MDEGMAIILVKSITRKIGLTIPVRPIVAEPRLRCSNLPLHSHSWKWLQRVNTV